MHKNQNTISKPLVFSRWSRKNYAAFASLKKEVVIAYLKFDVCVAAMLKCKNLILSLIEPSDLDQMSIDDIDREQSVSIADLLSALGLNTVSVQLDIACEIEIENKDIFNQSLFVA